MGALTWKHCCSSFWSNSQHLMIFVPFHEVFLDWTWNGRKQFTIDYHFYFLCLLQGCSYPIRVFDWLQIVNAMTTEPSGKRKLIVTTPTRNSYLICIAVMSGKETLIDPNLFCLFLIPDNNCHLYSKSQRFVMSWIWIISDTISTCKRFDLLSCAGWI